ncbi:MAG: thioredoxin family protein [Marinilabiliales bacterium]|nr:MAG: thioredoxin family protein [Marinilabiliales bacterium]
MTKVIAILFLFFIVCTGVAQDSVSIYNPDSDAGKDIELAVAKAKESNKHVLLQIGGNWCPWCIKLHKFYNDNPIIDSILKADYILVMVNYSRENKNEELLKNLGYPQRFGFPVLVVLDENGNRIHTQDSALLEKGTLYDLEKLKRFLLNWNRAAVSPGSYMDKK